MRIVIIRGETLIKFISLHTKYIIRNLILRLLIFRALCGETCLTC